MGSWDRTQTLPLHVVRAIVWLVTNIILTSDGATPVGNPFELPLIVNFWKVELLVRLASKIVPSVAQAYKPSVANKIPWTVETKSLATAIFRGFAAPKAG